MEADQSAGIDLPVKALVYPYAAGMAWLSCKIRVGLRSGTDSPPPSPGMSKS